MWLFVTEQRKDEDYDDVVEENLLNEVHAFIAYFYAGNKVWV